MRYIALATSIALMLGGAALAQEPSDIHQHTTPPPNARFEIVQSELAAKWTFRLDRFKGHVAQLVKTKDGEDTWEEMAAIGLASIQNPTRARFQLFTSGIAARHTFMIDTDTGKTWVLVSNKKTREDGTEEEVNAWQPFAE